MTQSPFGLDISASLATTADQWDAALLMFFELRSDPMALIREPIDRDERFIMGPVFRAAYTVLGGAPVTSDSVETDVQLVAARRGTATTAELAHADALGQLARHNFTLAAHQWDKIAEANPRDLLAIRIAHDLYLHVGDSDRRLASLERSHGGFAQDEVGAGLVAGMRTFAYEELGRYDEAEALGRQVIANNPADIWAVHALAHVFEMQGRTESALDLLSPDGRWTTHDLLSNHLWWHRGIRLAAERRLDEALSIADLITFDETTAFSMCDYTSLLWRIEYQGGDVGDRWDRVVELWPQTAARHTNGFLDLHAMLAFAATDSPDATAWLRTLQQRVDRAAESSDRSENDDIFASVAQPLVTAIAQIRSANRPAAIAAIEALGPTLHRIGGSVAQRDVISLSTRGATFGEQP